MSQQQQPTLYALEKLSHNNFIINTEPFLQNRLKKKISEEEKIGYAKMLVILTTGEQRLITFALPRESCTVHDLLKQIGVQFNKDTLIQCVENPGAYIDFVVTVGRSVLESPSELIARAEKNLQMTYRQQQQHTTTDVEPVVLPLKGEHPPKNAPST